MTPTQKKTFEIPILLLLLWTLQALELSIMQLPFFVGVPQIVSFIVAYIAFTRDWGMIAILSFAFAALGSANVTYASGIFIAAHMWTALFVKLAASSLTLEGRQSFVMLMVAFHFLYSLMVMILLHFVNAGPTLPSFFAQFFVQVLYVAAGAFLLYPLFQKWDEFFDHAEEDENSLSRGPSLSRR